MDKEKNTRERGCSRTLSRSGPQVKLLSGLKNKISDRLRHSQKKNKWDGATLFRIYREESFDHTFSGKVANLFES